MAAMVNVSAYFYKKQARKQYNVHVGDSSIMVSGHVMHIYRPYRHESDGSTLEGVVFAEKSVPVRVAGLCPLTSHPTVSRD